MHIYICICIYHTYIHIRRVRLNWYFRDEPNPFCSEQPSFSLKSSWSPPARYPNLKVFLSQIEHKLFMILDKSLTYSSITKGEWQAIISLADDRSTVIKKADKGFCVAAWDKDDYLSEDEKHLCDKAIYKDVSFNGKCSVIYWQAVKKYLRVFKGKKLYQKRR